MNQWKYILFLVIASVLVFFRVCGHDFLIYDDAVNVYYNPFVVNFSPGNLLYFWLGTYKNLFIPLTYNLWSVQAKISQILSPAHGTLLDPRIFHTTNLLFHLANAVLVFSLLRGLLKDSLAATLGALFWAVHPVQTEAVAWVSGFKDLLSGFFSLLALRFFLAYGQTASRGWPFRHRWYLLATLFFVCALLSKPSAVMVPLLAAVIAFWLLDRQPRQLGRDLLPWLLLTLPVVVGTKMSQPDDLYPYMMLPSLWQRFLIAGDTLSFYLYKLAFPLRLCTDYGRSPEYVLGHGWVYGTGLLPYALLGLLLWRGRKREALAAVGLFAAWLLPVLGFVTFIHQYYSTPADRYLYLALLGPAYGLGWFLARRREPWPRLACAGLLLLLGLKTVAQTGVWKNPETLNRHILTVNPASPIGHNNLAIVLRHQGRNPEAQAYLERLIRIAPEYHMAYFNMGKIMEDLAMPEEAMDYYGKVLDLMPTYGEAHYARGRLLMDAANWQQALASLEEAVRLKPSFAESRVNLGIVLVRLNRLPEAENQFRIALRIDPTDPGAYNGLGVALIRLGRKTEAQAAFEAAVRLAPGYGEARENLERIRSMEATEE
ncbi:MAG: tetratricopeptide repeat protein [Thermodesulfobacteriota bacterium]